MSSRERPEVAPPRGSRRLTVGVVTDSKYDRAYFTIQGLRLYHPEVQADIEIVVVDTHPGGAAAQALRQLETWIPNYRYIPFEGGPGTAERDVVFREARTEFVLCLDGGVMLAPGALKKLLDYFEAHPDTPDLLQGPWLRDDLIDVRTHLEPDQGERRGWRVATDGRGTSPDAAPFEIPAQSLGLFACRRAAWPGLSLRLRSVAEREGYLHEAIRWAGGRVLCLPFLRWLHPNAYPTDVRAAVDDLTYVRGELMRARELGQSDAEVDARVAASLGAVAEDLLLEARTQLANPFLFFDAIYCINLDEETKRWQRMTRRFEILGIDWVVQRVSAVRTPENHHVGCALSHRCIIEDAKRRGLEQVLVFEDDAIFRFDTLPYLARAIAELRRQEWWVFYLGGHKWEQQFPLAPGCEYLEALTGTVTCTHAVAYHHSVYDRILADIPATEAEVLAWLDKYYAIDQYLAYHVDRRFLARPILSCQPFLIKQEAPADQAKFVI